MHLTCFWTDNYVMLPHEGSTTKCGSKNGDNVVIMTKDKNTLDSIKCNNVPTTSSSKLVTQKDVSEVEGGASFKEDERRKFLAQKQMLYDKYHLPSYKEQYLMGKYCLPYTCSIGHDHSKKIWYKVLKFI